MGRLGVLAVAVLATGCGRLGYDDNLGRGDAERGDASGSATGLDLGEDIVVSLPAASDPVVAWTGDGFGVAWAQTHDDQRGISFLPLDQSGEAMSDERRVGETTEGADDAALVWTGLEFGLAWRDIRGEQAEAHFALLSREGLLIGPERRVSTGLGDVAEQVIAYTGEGFALAWHDARTGQNEVYLARLAVDGALLGETRVAVGKSVGLGSTGTELGVAWREGDVFFAGLDSSGSPRAPAQLSSSGQAGRLSVVWIGDEFAVAFLDARSGQPEIYLARVRPDGAVAGPEVRLTRSDRGAQRPRLAWSGTHLALAWEDVVSDVSRKSRVVLLERDGTAVGEEVLLGTTEKSSDASIAWAGDRFVAVWENKEDGKDSIRFAPLFVR
jgi:hypothetical protein